jgi:hypothetical protein
LYGKNLIEVESEARVIRCVERRNSGRDEERLKNVHSIIVKGKTFAPEYYFTVG